MAKKVGGAKKSSSVKRTTHKSHVNKSKVAKKTEAAKAVKDAKDVKGAKEAKETKESKEGIKTEDKAELSKLAEQKAKEEGEKTEEAKKPEEQKTEELEKAIEDLRKELEDLKEKLAQQGAAGETGEAGGESGGGCSGGGDQGGGGPQGPQGASPMQGMNPLQALGNQDPNQVLMKDIQMVLAAEKQGNRRAAFGAAQKLATDYTMFKAQGAMILPQVEGQVQQILKRYGINVANFGVGSGIPPALQGMMGGIPGVAPGGIPGVGGGIGNIPRASQPRIGVPGIGFPRRITNFRPSRRSSPPRRLGVRWGRGIPGRFGRVNRNRLARLADSKRTVLSKVDLNKEASSNEIVRNAFKYLGVRYVFGGNDPRIGLDCSSFTQRVYRDVGIRIPRTAASQARVAKPVSLRDARPGDLIFFKNTYKRGISHVGIYLGNGKFIHASSKKGVTVSSLNSRYYRKHFAFIGRIAKYA